MSESTVSCASCGAHNRVTAKFCSECGGTLAAEITCSGCGTTHPVGKKFCDECGTPLAGAAPAASAPRAEPALPPKLGGRYEATRSLGEGGRKRVYLATDTRLNRDVALAVFKSEGADETSLQRARREAEAMAKLGDHPNVVNVYDIGEEDGLLYLVSQYMSGGDLEGLAGEAEDRRLAVREVIRIGREMASALAHAHSNGVVHRDLKPQNIWLAPDGTAKLGDFGLAMAEGASRLTAEGAMVGTVAYMPPEQGLGRPAEPRSDIYSMGAVLYELLCGVPPFVGDDAASVISQHVSSTPVGPTWHRDDVPQALEQLVLSMLAKTPDDRPADAAEVRDALETIALAGPEASAGPGLDEKALERLSGGTLLGRDAESRQLRDALDEALAQRGRLVLLGGEAGVGKTRLATDLETYAELRGAQVLWGRCHQGEGAPAYWPWVQVIRAYAHDRDPGELASELGSGASEVAQIVSDLRDRIPNLPEPQPLDPEQARFRMLDSISAFLVNAARRRPLAIFLDDMHLADKPSLMLLEFLARQLGTARLFILGTHRDDDPEHSLPSDVTTAVRRERGVAEMKLRGLGETHVRAMLENALHQSLASPSELALVEAVCRESEGNPYFVEEMTRHLIDSGALTRADDRWTVDVDRIDGDRGIAQGIRDTVGQRLSSLSEEARELLSVAAVVGREFDLDTLTRVSGHEAAAVVERLQEAIRRGSVRASDHGRGSYAFGQAATRDALYDELPASRRASLHKAIGEALEERYGDRVESHLGELAHHFSKAVPAEDPAKGADYAWWAGERAAALYAYEEAAAHFKTALELFEMLDDEPNRRCELLLAVGDARWRAGETDRAKATFLEAADLARRLVLDQQFARAALGYGLGPGGFAVTDHADAKLVELLKAALDLLPPRDSVLRVRVMARLAVELANVGDRADPDRLSREAVEMAERVGDTKILQLAIYSRQWSMTGPDAIEESLAGSDEIIRLARIARDRDMEFAGHHLRLIALIQLGRMSDVDEQIEACDRLAGELRQPNYEWWASVFRAMRALVQGRFEESDRLAQSALKLGARWHEEVPVVVFGAQSFLVRWGEGKMDDLVEPGRQFADKYGQAWRTAFIWLLTETGHLDEARDRFRELAANDFKGLRWNTDWMTAMCGLAMSALALEERAAAETIYVQFAPHADRYAAFIAGSGCLGSNHAFVGFAAKAANRLDDAISHFDEALARNSAIGAEYLTPRIHYERAKALLERGREDDGAAAQDAVEAGLASARALGMAKEVERLMTVRLEERGLADIDVSTSIDHVQIEVAEDKPDLSPVAAPDGTVTIMFSDIEDSTVLTDRLGDHRWMELLREHDGVIRRQLAAHGGFEVKSQGDGFMLAFGSARAAIQCAMAIQRELEDRRNNGAREPLNVRIGLHTGEVLRERDDFFGKNVVLAARIAGKATGNEILVSGLLRELVASSQEFEFSAERELELKGLPGTHRVFSVDWNGVPAGASTAG
jgi:class 3 adenylate cyclase